MEPKFKEIVRRDPNVDLKNKPMNEWPTADKMQGIFGGPVAVAIKSGLFDKFIDAARKWSLGKYEPRNLKQWPDGRYNGILNNGNKI